MTQREYLLSVCDAIDNFDVIEAARPRVAPLIIVLALGTSMTSGVESLRECRKDLLADFAKVDYREERTAYPLPFGWREPMGCAGSLGMAPAGSRCTHAAARRDARRRRRTRWLAEMRAA